jgi:hypothetical protein
MAIIKGNKIIPKDNDCGCGKAIKVTDPRKRIVKKTVRKNV